MQKEELFNDIESNQGVTEKYLGLSVGKFLLFFLIVTVFGVYIGILLYGTNSLDVLLDLQDYESYLQSEISRLKNENSELQRVYFELEGISAK